MPFSFEYVDLERKFDFSKGFNMLLFVKKQQRHTIFTISHDSDSKSKRASEIFYLSFQIDTLSIFESFCYVCIEFGESSPLWCVYDSCLTQTDFFVFSGKGHQFDVLAVKQSTCFDEFILSIDGLNYTEILTSLHISNKHLRVVDLGMLITFSVDV